MGEHSDTRRVYDETSDQIVEEDDAVAQAPANDGLQDEPEHPPRSGSRWLGLAALLLALVALAIASISVIRPDWTERFDATPTTAAVAPPAPSGPSEQQIAEAKIRTCDAYNVVGAAVTLRSNAEMGPDPAAPQAEIVQANARQSFTVGHDYLESHVDAATPPPLADAVKRFAGALEDVAINALAGVANDDPAQAGRLQSMVDLNGQINELCK